MANLQRTGDGVQWREETKGIVRVSGMVHLCLYSDLASDSLHPHLNRTRFIGFLLMLLNSSKNPSTISRNLSTFGTST